MLLKNFRMQLICISMDGNVPYLDKVPAGKLKIAFYVRIL